MDSLKFETMNVTNATPESPPLHETNSPQAISEAVTLVIIMIASFFTNILAMTQILTSKKLRKNHHNLLIANLNVIDLGITLFSMTFSVAAIFDDGYLLRNNATICTINGFCAITCSVGNFTNVMCIAVDRYISIVWSTRFPPTRNRVYCMIAFVWVVSVTITLPPTFEFLSAFEYTENTHHCSPSWNVHSYFYIWFTVIFGVTVPVMIICYACIIYHIRKSDRKLRVYDGMKTSGKISKQLSGSRSSGSPQGSTNLRPNAGCPTHHNQMLQPNVNAKHPNLGKHNSDGISEARVNRGFHGDGLHLRDIIVDEYEPRIVGPGPYVISGQRCSLSPTQSLPILPIGDSGTQASSSANGQRGTGSAQTKSKTEEHDQRTRRHADSDQSVNHDNILNKMSARKLSVEKRVALTGAMLILTTIFCWAPYCIIHFPHFPPASHSWAAVTMWMAYANSLLDPLVYVFINRKESTVQHLMTIVRTCCNVPRKTWSRLCCRGTDR
nr:tyramine receptor 1-like [Lytechinus pictus]